MDNEPLDVVPLWLLFASVALVTGFALEGGYRVGRWRRSSSTEEKEAPVGAMVGSILALFAFMLAFTFGMAGNRFETRREVVLEEANAIGTAFLRTRLLPEPQRYESARLLREYVDVRIRGVREGKVQEAITRSEELHELLWVEAVKAGQSQPGPITGLYIQSLNETIDMHSKRIQVGLRNRIPFIIWIGLFALALLGMSSVGYHSGLAATRRSPAMLVLILAFSGVFFLIADLDRAHEGLLKVGQQAMVDVQQSMNPGKP
jgi:hypothetical protein